EVARRALSRMRDGTTLDLAREMTRITMGVVGATLFGAETFDAADELGESLTVALKWVDEALASSGLVVQIELIEAFERVSPRSPAPMASIQKRIAEALREPRLLPGRRDPELQEAVRKLDGALQRFLDERRANPQARIDLLTKLLLARDTDG